MTIYETADAAPYFETIGGRCRVMPISRQAVTTECDAPARLVRRELFFEGWRASINGERVPVLPAPPIVQAVDIPAGVARIAFDYRPPYAAAIGVAFLAGLLLLAVGAVRSPWR